MWLQNIKKVWLLVVALLALLILMACGGDVTQEDLDTVNAQLTASEQVAVQLRAQLASTVPVNVVQAGQLAPAPPGAQPTGWETEESIRGGLELLATFDSSGPDAWDVVASPMVYFTSEGASEAASPMQNKLPGVQVIDAYTKEVVGSALYDLGYAEYRDTAHGVGTSPDGKWIYTHYTVGPGREVGDAHLLIINARTLKVDTILHTTNPRTGNRRFHHMAGFTDWMGRDRVLINNGSGATGGPHFILDPNDNHRVVKSITYDDLGGPMGHAYSTVGPEGRFLYVAMGANWIQESPFTSAGIWKVNLETDDVVLIEEVGNHPIGMAHTADGKFTYIADGTGSKVYKIDNETDEVVGHTSAGVAGPYGLALNWDETLLYTIGKGEGSHNLGGVVGVVDTRTFAQSRSLLIQMPIWLGGSAASIDHAILHPDPDVNELWISNMKGWETIVLDLNTHKTEAYIPSPNGGDTHNGAFVEYDSNWNGELLSDMGGPHRKMYETKLQIINGG
ncbi:MAG: hypothetical protein HQ475_03360 [SAR202 cluster bacterium]|nr:hypothetical protein [SAR202 cluster bacterium]